MYQYALKSYSVFPMNYTKFRNKIFPNKNSIQRPHYLINNKVVTKKGSSQYIQQYFNKTYIMN